MITSVLHISSGMNEDGGGTAHLGRLIGASLRRHCARHRLTFRGLHLPPLDGSVATDGYAAFGGSRSRLTAAVVIHLGCPFRDRTLQMTICERIAGMSSDGERTQARK